MNYAEKVWDTIDRAWGGDLKAQLSLLCVDIALNGDSRLIKEEKKMLNFDKYREEVEKRAAWAVREGSKNPKPAHLVLNEIIIGKCLPYMKGNELVDWLFEEYEPPLLENGDGLKPGDWIMVRNFEGEEWIGRQFAFFHNGWFYCLRGGSNFAQLHLYPLQRWERARLPEDGE